MTCALGGFVMICRRSVPISAPGAAGGGGVLPAREVRASPPRAPARRLHDRVPARPPPPGVRARLLHVRRRGLRPRALRPRLHARRVRAGGVRPRRAGGSAPPSRAPRPARRVRAREARAQRRLSDARFFSIF